MMRLAYAKALTVYVPVFLSLVEYAVILRRIVSSRKKKHKKRDQVSSKNKNSK